MEVGSRSIAARKDNQTAASRARVRPASCWAVNAMLVDCMVLCHELLARLCSRHVLSVSLFARLANKDTERT